MLIDDIKADFQRVSNRQPNFLTYLFKAVTNPGFRAIFFYRLGRELKKRKTIFLPGLFQRLILHTCYCSISLSADIGPGFLISHVGGIVIGGKTKIGQNCDIRQNVSFGGNYQKVRDGRTQPLVGDNVSFGVGAVIIGPVCIGSNSIIGANSVVNRDIPENVIAFGIPAKVLKSRWEDSSGRSL